MTLLLLFALSFLMNPSTPTLHEKSVLTPITEQELVEVLQKSHIEVFGKKAPKGRIAMAWAQIAFENGRGKIVLNHNLGNIGAGKNERYYRRGPTRFRIFTSFDEAANVYWRLLRDRCSAAMYTFEAMDAKYTAFKLRRCGYHRADIDRYARGLSGLMWVAYKLLADG